ncbi:MAG: tryptophan 7-halogenase [Chloroflexi bacterium]|nr:tryptophan 7-halogenase [Chloroflexota bacterium]
MEQSHQVVVIGGGPGGSTTATMLARRGVDVLLLEREHFPREHVGESLLPASIPVLEELGVLPAVEQAGFLRKWGATMVWGRDSTPWSWYFKETNQRYPHSYQVWRPQFDQLLLENSRSNGVDVREGHRVVEVLFDGAKATGVRYGSGNGALSTVHAEMVVDASGQGGLLARELDLRRWDPFFQNLAVYGYFTGAQRLPAPDEGNIFIEAAGHGWLWNIPLHTGWASIGAVVDSPRGQEGIKKAGAERFLKAQIAQAPHTAGMLRDAEMVSGPHVVKDWSYVCDQLVGDGYVLVGDAACFVDPLFSSGVHLALMSGVLAAAYVTTALKDAELGAAAAVAYQELYFKEYSHFREMARLFYSSNLAAESYFWEARRLLDGAGNFSPRHAFIQAVAGQPPQGYERAVLDQGRAPEDFLASVKEVESFRAGRRARVEAARTAPGTAASPLIHSVPRLAEGVRLERKAVVGAGEFLWGYVLTTVSQPDGTPCSNLVARLISTIDGRTPVSQILARMADTGGSGQEAQIRQSVLTALEILYVDGTVEELQGL